MDGEEWFLFNSAQQPDDTVVRQGVADLYKLTLEEVQVETLKSSQNFTYKVTIPTGCFVGRLTPDVHQESGPIQAELNFLKFVASKGVSVCQPVSPIHEMQTEKGKFFLVLFEFAKGRDPMKDGWGSWIHDTKFIFEWGKWLGAFHNAALLCDEKDRPQWDEVHSRVQARGRDVFTDPEKDAKPLAEYLELDAWVKTLPTDRSCFGLIHGDLNISNFFVDDYKLHVFDWDQLQFGWCTYDIAVVFWMILYLKHGVPDCATLDIELFEKSFLDGYKESRQATEEELSWIPNFVRIRKIFYVLFCTKTMRDMELEASKKVNIPAWFPGLAKSVFDVYDKLSA